MDATSYLRFIVALVFVLALIGVFGLLLRRFGPGAGLVARARGDRRLAVVEVLPLDAKRRLVLVRRDGVEHLLLLGAATDLVVEGGLPAAPPPPQPATQPKPPSLAFREALARVRGEPARTGGTAGGPADGNGA
ncbi:FliO/MopB family protein [Rhodospirillum centenum]|uniref:Flagellar assembly protein FliO, putative n=1 Tax=Rhodospirillum centenum (strain ATCC 51521 / SW) TaxID=414684 RepID=B6IS81_RHOCS|nr:flagellar biosynthetic protein FliO [Rhodospirillum centenum]ACI98317.1 flagellar assembly protein FliO, putative [Rhodospirillum centenum SW]